MKKYFISIVLLQISLILFLFYIITKNTNILGTSVTVINSQSLLRSPSSELKHFYEIKANHIEEQHADWLWYTPIHTINKDSLNERYDYKIKKEKGTFRIIALGDSFTDGSWVHTKDNWTEQLEDYLNQNKVCDTIQKYEVINLGVQGYDLAYETERYVKRGVKYDPDLIVLPIVDFLRVTEHRLKNENKIKLTENQIKEYQKEGNFYPESFLLDSQLSVDYKINYQIKNLERLESKLLKPQKLIFFDIEKNKKQKKQSVDL